LTVHFDVLESIRRLGCFAREICFANLEILVLGDKNCPLTYSAPGRPDDLDGDFFFLKFIITWVKKPQTYIFQSYNHLYIITSDDQSSNNSFVPCS